MSKEVTIIGSGVIGLCTAFYSARRGHRVTVLDAHEEDHGGCSFGNAGMIVPSHFVPLAAPGMVALGLKWMWNPESPFYIKPRLNADLFDWGFKFWRASTVAHVTEASPLLRDLSFASKALFEQLASECGNDFQLVRRGLLMLCKTQHALDEEAKTAAVANALGVSAQVLDAQQTAAMEEAAAVDVAGSVYFPHDCHLTPQLFLKSLKQMCKQAGVEFIWNARVTNVNAVGSLVNSVTTDKGEIATQQLVLSAGSWSAELARGLGLKIPMQAGKGYSLTLKAPPKLPRICSILCEARVAVTPMGEALRVGGTMEIAGLNESISQRRVRGIIKALPQYYPEFAASDFDGIEPWCGLRPCSPDGLPYVGRTAKYDNVCIATGHAMMGLSLGPVTGKIISQILDGESPSHDLRKLSPDRFA